MEHKRSPVLPWFNFQLSFAMIQLSAFPALKHGLHCSLRCSSLEVWATFTGGFPKREKKGGRGRVAKGERRNFCQRNTLDFSPCLLECPLRENSQHTKLALQAEELIRSACWWHYDFMWHFRGVKETSISVVLLGFLLLSCCGFKPANITQVSDFNDT